MYAIARMVVGLAGLTVAVAGAAAAPERDGGSNLASIAATAADAVVSIVATPTRRRAASESSFQQLVEDAKRGRTRARLGSGVVLDSSGLIATSLHVVRYAGTITVRFSDGTKRQADLVAADHDRDLAMLRVSEGETLLRTPWLALGETPQVGATVIAFGNSATARFPWSIGVVTAVGRRIDSPGVSYAGDDLLETDAAIGPGDSGGPLLNRKGEVVGILTAAVGGVPGAGLVIPVDRIAVLLLQVRGKGGRR